MAKETSVKIRRVRRAALSFVLICFSLFSLFVPFSSSARPASSAVTPTTDPSYPQSVLGDGQPGSPSLGLVEPITAPSYPQSVPIDAPQQSASKVPAITGATYDARLLVIAADGTESDLAAIRQSLNFLGTPYTVYTATLHPNGLTASQ